MKKLKQSNIYFGCDPEFFFKKENQIIGAEKVLPQDGLNTAGGRVVIDGVQAELNPQASTCREVLSRNIGYCLGEVRDLMMRNKCQADFSQTIKVTEEEMNSLSDKCKQFGCSKSENVYNKDADTGVSDASKFMSRSGGGHLHIGKVRDIYNETYQIQKDMFEKHPDRLVRMLDIIVGNTCVLIDRDKGNKIRRQTYGRAGEHRLPSHGLEYRTLSNFWLQSYTLMSFVTSLTRLAVSVVCNLDGTELEDKILNSVDIKKVVKAINENDANLAQETFDIIKLILADACSSQQKYFNAPFTPENLKYVDFFIKKIQKEGLKFWFADDMSDVIAHWTGLAYGRRDNYKYYGFESFIDTVVKNEYNKKPKTLGRKIKDLLEIK
jgi:hypothetical protein